MRALYSSVRFLSFASNSSLRPPSSASMSRVLRSRSMGASAASASPSAAPPSPSPGASSAPGSASGPASARPETPGT